MMRNRIAIFVLAVCVLLSFAACALDPPASIESDSVSSKAESCGLAEGALRVHYLDVGQGDSIFLELPDQTCMLIDASEADYGETIVETVRSLGYSRIDYVIATHPHADHIGGMKTVLSSLEIGCVYLPDVSASTATYIGMAETILERNIPAEIAQAGVQILNQPGLQAEFLAPQQIDESDQNRNSAVLLLTYGQTRFLFMGDADQSIENSLDASVRCDVLKVGHHGSRTASGASFLAQIQPRYAVISCGKDNSYGHPHAEAFERLQNCGAEILRTDWLGTITVYSDGITVWINSSGTDDSSADGSSWSHANSGVMETSSDASCEERVWILNTSTKKVHVPTCSHIDAIADHNRAESSKSLEELYADGYTACGACKPG